MSTRQDKAAETVGTQRLAACAGSMAVLEYPISDIGPLFASPLLPPGVASLPDDSLLTTSPPQIINRRPSSNDQRADERQAVLRAESVFTTNHRANSVNRSGEIG